MPLVSSELDATALLMEVVLIDATSLLTSKICVGLAVPKAWLATGNPTLEASMWGMRMQDAEKLENACQALDLQFRVCCIPAPAAMQSGDLLLLPSS